MLVSLRIGASARRVARGSERSERDHERDGNERSDAKLGGTFRHVRVRVRAPDSPGLAATRGAARRRAMLCLVSAMAEKLIRFGVAMEEELLRDFDRVVESRGGTRSEALRDLARAAVIRAQVRRGADAVAALTLVYDHHVRDLTERLTELQHELGDHVRSTVHVHLDHDHCLEVIVMQGRSDELQSIADRMLALRGVKHGGIELYVGGASHARPPGHSHAPGHAHHDHAVPAKPARRAALPARKLKPKPKAKRS